MKLLKIILPCVLVLGLLSACKSLKLDYAEPAAQFNEAAVATKGTDYVGKKITIKGVVTQQDLSDPENCQIALGYGIVCNFGALKDMALSYKVGDTVYVDGILKRCAEGDILLTPAMGRDPQAKFEPIE